MSFTFCWHLNTTNHWFLSGLWILLTSKHHKAYTSQCALHSVDIYKPQNTQFSVSFTCCGDPKTTTHTLLDKLYILWTSKDHKAIGALLTVHIQRPQNTHTSKHYKPINTHFSVRSTLCWDWNTTWGLHVHCIYIIPTLMWLQNNP